MAKNCLDSAFDKILFREKIKSSWSNFSPTFHNYPDTHRQKNKKASMDSDSAPENTNEGVLQSSSEESESNFSNDQHEQNLRYIRRRLKNQKEKTFISKPVTLLEIMLHNKNWTHQDMIENIATH